MTTSGRIIQPQHTTPLTPRLPFAQQEIVRTLIGETLLPGPHGLCSHIGKLLDITANDHVLIVSPDPSASALGLAQEFGCSVVGVITQAEHIERARRRVEGQRRVEIRAGNIERLPFRTQRFNVAISEGTFAASSNKSAAATQLYTVLRERGRLALVEPTLYREMISEELAPLFSWLTPFVGARPAGVYRSILAERGFSDFIVEDRRQDLSRAAEIARQKLLLFNLASNSDPLLMPPSEDLEASVQLAQNILETITRGVASFALITAERG